MRNISVSVVYATANRQWLKEFRMARGSSAAELIDKSGFMTDIDALQNVEVERLKLGVFAQKVALDYLLEDGDRLEIYRPLAADPKEVRRQLALLGKSIGNR
ncbi:MAG: RnfH family protein [Gammaproteobacteria bacterium]|nr:RnfH family protein [Gammaproteobacteria bacterium]